MKRKFAVLFAAGLLVLGLAVLLYPTVSSAINRANGSYAIQQYQQQLEDMDSSQMQSALEKAIQYNEQLKSNGQPDEEEYDAILDFGNGIMGYIAIEKIGVLLPIYHGVSSEVLEKGVGHLPSSMFPVGGTGNHTVLTGHTGLPSARLFTDLEELAVGDMFEVTVGSHSVLYLIDQILTVLPAETEALMPVSGEDYCTLVTCTPYGVNSHRLLVRGSRVGLAETETVPQATEATEPELGRSWRWMLALIPFLLLLVWVRKRVHNG